MLKKGQEKDKVADLKEWQPKIWVLVKYIKINPYISHQSKRTTFFMELTDIDYKLKQE